MGRAELHRLALELGMNSALLETMSHDKLIEWLQFNKGPGIPAHSHSDETSSSRRRSGKSLSAWRLSEALPDISPPPKNSLPSASPKISKSKMRELTATEKGMLRAAMVRPAVFQSLNATEVPQRVPQAHDGDTESCVWQLNSLIESCSAQLCDKGEVPTSQDSVAQQLQ